MADKRDARVRDAEQAKLEALVDEHGTQGEKFALDLSQLRETGIGLRQLHAIAAGDAEVPLRPPDPVLLAATVKRIHTRQRLGIVKRDCVHKQSCVCLRDVLDVLPSETKRKVIAESRRLHKDRHPQGPLARFRHLIPKPKPPVAREPLMTPPAPVPAPAAQVTEVTETQTGNFRPVRRRPKWWDPPGGTNSIRDMKF
jgi:hypothetical protein